jgi:ABC-type multidrug transport system fused ATPase/permease subunit
VELRYRDGPLVLKEISFDIQGGEKIGIAGRTGSGKSSLMVALFRIVELAGGVIQIDDVDISTLGLTELRTKLGIIPQVRHSRCLACMLRIVQDPVMFANTLRFNLDPFNERSDTELWQALESVQLKTHLLSLPDKLEHIVSEGGENFSQGQRQLLCIARVLLRKPRVVVMDEATSSIDNDTDASIQEMITTCFAQCTVLTIAHRLHTIINSDRVMVLQEGRIVEFDKPDMLLQIPDGYFKTLWQQHKSQMQRDAQ